MGTVLGCMLGLGTASAQGELELATYYYNSGAFEQAKLYLDNLWKKDPSVYDMYLNTLLELEAYEEAETIVKSRLKKSRDKSMAQVDLGSLYLKIGKTEAAQEAFEKALDELPAGRGPTKRLAEAFIKLDQLDLALASYEKAMKNTKDKYGYHYELANLQGLFKAIIPNVDNSSSKALKVGLIWIMEEPIKVEVKYYSSMYNSHFPSIIA